MRSFLQVLRNFIFLGKIVTLVFIQVLLVIHLSVIWISRRTGPHQRLLPIVWSIETLELWIVEIWVT
jgi:hypothetical protein